MYFNLKKSVIIFILFTTILSIGFTQNSNSELDTDNLLIHQSSILFSPYHYQFLDGTAMVNQNKLRSLLLNVPENKKILKQEKIIRIVAISFGVICTSFVVGDQLYRFRDLPNRETMSLVCYTGEAVSLALTLFTGMIANNKIAQSVDNYNLYIMGFPIPEKKR